MIVNSFLIHSTGDPVMTENKKAKVKISFRILETLVDVIALAYGLQLLTKGIQENGKADISLFFTVFMLNAVAYFLSAFNTRYKQKIVYVKFLVIAISYAVISLILAVLPDSGNVVTYIFVIYLLSFVFDRIVAIIRKRRVLRIIVNVVLIILCAWLLLSIFYPEWNDQYSALFIGITIPIQMLVRVTVLSFSHFRYDILVNVVKKSMALEILSGLLILIVSFSFAFTIFEPAIPTYIDALWYSFAIVTTIGFGDIVATHVLGRLLSVILGIYGLVVVALITSIIVNFYTEVNKTPSSPENTLEDKEV